MNAQVFFSDRRNGANPVVHQTCFSPLWKHSIWSFAHGKVLRPKEKRTLWPKLTCQQLCTSFQCLPDSPPDSDMPISGGSRVQQIRLHPPTHPLLEACKDINLMRVQNGLIEIKCTQKNSWVFCYFLVQSLFETFVVWGFTQDNQKTKTTICLFGFLQKNPWLNTARFKRMAFVVTWHNKFWNTSFTIK